MIMHKLYTIIAGSIVPKVSIGDKRNRPRVSKKITALMNV